MRNLHISLTEFRNESRVLRETLSLTRSGLVDHLDIVAMAGTGLAYEERIDEVRVLRRLELRTRGLPKFLIFQMVKYLEFALRTFLFAQQSRPDMVNVHSLGLLPVGTLLKAVLGIQLVYDAHELETETEGLNGIRKKLAKFAERVFIRFADLTITVSPSICAWYQSEYGLDSVVCVMNTPARTFVSKPGRLRVNLGISTDTRLCLYQGLLTSGRGVELALETFQTAPPDNTVMVFMGYGELEGAIRAAAKNSSSVLYHPAVLPCELLEHTVDADVGLCVIENSCLSYHYCLPNKLFEYAMAGVPVICSDLPEMRLIVGPYCVGEILAEDTPAALAGAIERLMSANSDDMKVRLDYLSEEFCWESQERVMISAYQEHVFGK